MIIQNLFDIGIRPVLRNSIEVFNNKTNLACQIPKLIYVKRNYSTLKNATQRQNFRTVSSM